MKISNVLMGLILSKQEDTFCMNVWDIMSIGTLEEMLLVISSCFWMPTLELSLLLTMFSQSAQVDLGATLSFFFFLQISFYFPFSLSFQSLWLVLHLFSLSLSLQLSFLHVVSFSCTTVYHHVSCNKLLIQKKKMKPRYLQVSLGRSKVLWQPLNTQGPMISLTSKPQRRSIMWEFTRELDKEPLLN